MYANADYRWLTSAAPLLLDANGGGSGPEAATSKLQVTDLNNLCSAVVEASNVISLFASYYGAAAAPTNSEGGGGKVDAIRSAVHTMRNFVLSDSDAANIRDAQAAVKEAVLAFKTTLSGAQALQNIKLPLDKLQEALRPTLFHDTIQRKYDEYFEGSREWLMADTLAWLDDDLDPAASQGSAGKKKVRRPPPSLLLLY